MINTKNQRLLLYLPIVLCLAFIVWWIGINFLNWPSGNNYTDSYGVIALTASIAGFVAAKKWGTFKSRFGATIAYISLGLFLQFLGNLIYTLYFRIGNVELAYPSVGDIPYLLTGVVYTLGLYNLLKMLIRKGSLFRPAYVLIVSLVSTATLSVLVYVSFLHLGVHDPRGTIYSLANIAYPLIQAVYFLLGVVALLQAKRMSGGKMFSAVLLLLVALVVQYAADFSFLYQDYHNTWQPAGSNDLFYTLAYGLMAVALLCIENVRRNALLAPKGDSEAGDI